MSDRVLLGLIAGAMWNLASLWCLKQMLQGWLGPNPSRRRAVLWLLVKFPLLYALAVLLLRSPSVSLAAFGAGFSLVLLVVIGWAAVQAQRPVTLRPHGR